MSERSDETYLNDMLAYSRDALQFVEGKTRASLDHDLVLARALIYTTDVVGEAASHISAEFRNAAPQVPWSQINGMRNRLFHGYGDLNYDRLWATITLAIPSLVTELEKLVPPSEL